LKAQRRIHNRAATQIIGNVVVAIDRGRAVANERQAAKTATAILAVTQQRTPRFPDQTARHFLQTTATTQSTAQRVHRDHHAAIAARVAAIADHVARNPVQEIQTAEVRCQSLRRRRTNSAECG
jgi:hypothetical protein